MSLITKRDLATDTSNKSRRFVSLDVFRGLTMILMILVNSPGNQVTYSWLEHSAWNGCTLADVVFPFFLVIVGASAVLSLHYTLSKHLPRKQLLIKVLKRGIFLFLIGLLLNAFPHHFDLSTIRILGVLQRIAICYILAAVLFLTTTQRQQIGLIGILLIGYWGLMSHFAINQPLTMTHNLVGAIDIILLKPSHLYTTTFDPEGLISTLPALASTLFGNLLGYALLSSRRYQQTFAYITISGLCLITLGWLWHVIYPFNKALWSGSYVLWTSGLAYLIYALCFWCIEIKKWHTGYGLVAFFGKNALLVYVLHVFFLKIQAMIMISTTQGKAVNLRVYMTDLLFGKLSLLNASLAYAVLYTLFWFFIIQLKKMYTLKSIQ